MRRWGSSFLWALAFASVLMLTLAACAEEEPEEGPTTAATATPSATPTVDLGLLHNGEWIPEVLSYAEEMGVTPEEAARRLTLQFVLGEHLEQFRAIAPERQAGIWIQHEPDFRLVVAYKGPDVGLEAAHELAAKAPGPVEIRTGLPHAEGDWERAHDVLRETAVALGLLRQEDMMSSGTSIIEGFLELSVTRRPPGEAATVENALSAALGVPVRLKVYDEIPPFGTQPAQASAADPIARSLPADAFNAAATEGMLVREGNCLYLEYGGSRALLSFPYQSEWDGATNTVVIGNRRVAVGDSFSGGGSGADASERNVPLRWGTAPAPACDTSRVWFLAPDVRVQ